jgi:hypothetical protein
MYEISRYAELINKQHRPEVEPGWNMIGWPETAREAVHELLVAAALAGFDKITSKLTISGPGIIRAVTISDDNGMQCSASGSSMVESLQALTAVLRNGYVAPVPTVRIGFKRTAADPYVAGLTAAGRQFSATGRDLDEVLSRLLLAVRVAAGSHRATEETT